MTHVVFVCWGNICRSPMAERVARARLDEAGLDDVEVTSAATSQEELGAPMDTRAARTLRQAGYNADGHHAHQITADEIASADLVVAMETLHVQKMRAITGRDNPNVVLLTDFDPAARPGEGVPDPWYGGQSGFTATLESIEAAMPQFIERVRQLRR